MLLISKLIPSTEADKLQLFLIDRVLTATSIEKFVREVTKQESSDGDAKISSVSFSSLIDDVMQICNETKFHLKLKIVSRNRTKL